MTLKLKSFQFKSNIPTGWNSEEIIFGDEFTILLGDNGTGKTPMMWGMAYALGYPLEMAPDVKNNVMSTSIVLEDGSTKYSFNRTVSEEFELNIYQDEGKPERFSSQRDYTKFIFELFGISTTDLTPSKGEKAVRPFISTFLPLIWISQSKGWTFPYQPLANQRFIRNQREEMVRLLFDIPPKNPFDRKKSYEEKKQELETLEHRIMLAKENIKSFKKEIGKVAKLKPEVLEMEKMRVRSLIDETRSQLSTSRRSTAELDASVDVHKVRMFRIRAEIQELELKRSGLEAAYAELDADSEVLESNELATDEFRKVCGTEGCKVFESARKQYGKRLLYLRDQLKDIQNSSNSLSSRISELKSAEQQELKGIESLEGAKQKILQDQGIDSSINLIEELGKEFSELDENLRKLRTLQKLNSNFVELLNDRTALEEIVKDLRPRAGKIDKTRLWDVVSYFRESFHKWLVILNTPNLKTSDVDETFDVYINGEKFTEDSFQDGSTRSRIVLAYFASLFETSLTQANKHPGFMFLDTPRQHELHLPHLQSYFSELRELIRRYKCQVVIACKDQIFAPQPTDKVYSPKFKFGEEVRYLGPAGLLSK